MRVTRENIQEFVSIAEELKDALESAIEAAEEWESTQDETDADAKREAREELDSQLDTIDASTLCQLLHGKHAATRKAVNR